MVKMLLSHRLYLPPYDTDSRLTREFLGAMRKYQHDASISFTSLEGYIAGRLFGAIAMAVNGELTREKFIETMETVGSFDLDGVVLTFGSDDHQGMDAIYLTRIYPILEKLHDDDLAIE
jgi:branched-chain amino acid transport system substrate-binding protein